MLLALVVFPVLSTGSLKPTLLFLASGDVWCLENLACPCSLEDFGHP